MISLAFFDNMNDVSASGRHASQPPRAAQHDKSTEISDQQMLKIRSHRKTVLDKGQGRDRRLCLCRSHSMPRQADLSLG
jgi:hypothetical protein